MYLERYTENLSKPPRLCSPNCCQKHKDYTLPEFNILFDLGDTVIVDSTKRREKYDNFNISKYFDSKGIRCIHVFPHDNADKILESVSDIQMYDAAEFQVYKLNLDYVQEFLELNDTTSYYKSTSLALGLIKDNEIYQIMTFASPRYKKHEFDYEIIRVCSKLHTKIAGGLDLLSSTASLKLEISSCIYYQDLSKNFYTEDFTNIGMRLDHINVPRLRSNDSVFDCGTAVMMFK